MNLWLILSAITTVVVAVAHSVLGELLIFRKLRNGGIVPTKGQGAIRSSHIRIIWATWHIVSIFGLGLSAILIYIALLPLTNIVPFVLGALAIVMGASSLLVLYATKGRHPGWIGMLIISAATVLARHSL